MARHKAYFSLFFVALALAGSGCGGGAEDLDAGIGFVNPGPFTQPDAGAAGLAGGTGTVGLAGGTGTVGLAGGTGTVGLAGGTGTAATAGGTGTVAGLGGPGGTGSDAGAGGSVDAGKDGGTAVVDGGGSSGDGGGTSADAGAGTGTGNTDGGTCCPDGNCLCHGTVPAKLSAAKGPFKTATLQLSTGTAYYPTDAQPPFAGVAICPGFLNVGPEMGDWGPFYASWGIVIVVTDTGAADLPEIRADLLLGSIKALKAENTKSGSPLNGKMSGRYGTSGYSMGGGGTTMASVTDPSLKSSIGLAPWEPVGNGIKVPTLLFCGDADLVAPCDYVDGSYAGIPNTTPKMKIVISGAEHLGSWFGPQDGGNGTSGGYALAFSKVFLEGDTRWKPLLLTKPAGHTMTTNIMP